MKLLYAEDEKYMAEAVSDVLTFHNYLVDVVYDGEDALQCALSGQYDGIILDVMMPKMSGVEVLKKIREKNITTPVMLLTAKGLTEDKIEGLDQGADDYLTKPFSMGELLARIRAMLRRKDEYTPSVLSFKDVVLDMRNYELRCHEKSVSLPKNEYQVIELLFLNKDIFMSSETIFIRIWGYDSDADISIVWVYISYLRKHLKDIGSEVKITAKRNVGYRLE